MTVISQDKLISIANAAGTPQAVKDAIYGGTFQVGSDTLTVGPLINAYIGTAAELSTVATNKNYGFFVQNTTAGLSHYQLFAVCLDDTGAVWTGTNGRAYQSGFSTGNTVFEIDPDYFNATHLAQYNTINTLPHGNTAGRGNLLSRANYPYMLYWNTEVDTLQLYVGNNTWVDIAGGSGGGGTGTGQQTAVYFTSAALDVTPGGMSTLPVASTTFNTVWTPTGQSAVKPGDIVFDADGTVAVYYATVAGAYNLSTLTSRDGVGKGMEYVAHSSSTTEYKDTGYNTIVGGDFYAFDTGTATNPPFKTHDFVYINTPNGDYYAVVLDTVFNTAQNRWETRFRVVSTSKTSGGGTASPFNTWRDVANRFGTLSHVIADNFDFTFDANWQGDIYGPTEPVKGDFVYFPLFTARVEAFIPAFGTTPDTMNLTVIAGLDSVTAGAVGDLITDVTDLQTKVTADETAISQLQTTVTTLGQDVADVQTDMNGKMDKVPSATAGNVAVFDSSGQVTAGPTLPSNLGTLANDVSTLQSQMSTAQTDITNLQNDLATTNTNVSNLSTSVSNLSTTVSNLSTTVSTTASEVSQLQTDVSQIATSTANLGNFNPVTGLNVGTATASTVPISTNTVNLETGATTSNAQTINLPEATATTAGVMTATMFQALGNAASVGALNTESTDRANADSNLQSQIDGLANLGRFLGAFDNYQTPQAGGNTIVPTNISYFAGLTPPLRVTLNDFVEVQTDETRGDKSTRYRVLAIDGTTGDITWGFSNAYSSDISGKADKVTTANAGDVAGLDATGNLISLGSLSSIAGTGIFQATNPMPWADFAAGHYSATTATVTPINSDGTNWNTKLYDVWLFKTTDTSGGSTDGYGKIGAFYVSVYTAGTPANITFSKLCEWWESDLAADAWDTLEDLTSNVIPDIQTKLGNRPTYPGSSSVTSGNIATWGTNGALADSGVTMQDITDDIGNAQNDIADLNNDMAGKVDKVTGKTDQLAVWTSTGALDAIPVDKVQLRTLMLDNIDLAGTGFDLTQPVTFPLSTSATITTSNYGSTTPKVGETIVYKSGTRQYHHIIVQVLTVSPWNMDTKPMVRESGIISTTGVTNVEMYADEATALAASTANPTWLCFYPDP
ncbi:MAG: hypothetical protein Pg6A_20000 [Termitinemataceae bacterium]|nr:MAG: hypothetical protein Pg6A_20000 [Termitinemataceae bacterium]